MQRILEALAQELERVRELPEQVVKHLGSHHEVAREDIGRFLDDTLPGLEDFEIDLILSPLFTPSLEDQSIFAALLGRDSIAEAQWPALVRHLAARPATVSIVAPDGAGHRVVLNEVLIERYVHRLRLDGTVPEPLFQLISHLSPAADRPLLLAVARRAIWESEPRREMLRRYLTSTTGDGECRISDVLALLRLAESYEPADTADVLARIPTWIKVLRHEISMASNPKPFFNERVQEMHGGGRDQRHREDGRLAAWEGDLAALDRLQKVLAG